MNLQLYRRIPFKANRPDKRVIMIKIGSTAHANGSVVMIESLSLQVSLYLADLDQVWDRSV